MIFLLPVFLPYSCNKYFPEDGDVFSREHRPKLNSNEYNLNLNHPSPPIRIDFHEILITTASGSVYAVRKHYMVGPVATAGPVTP